MTYIKLVNGVPVPMTNSEIVERRAEEAAWEERKKVLPEPTEIEILMKALEIKMNLTDEDKEAARLSLMTKETKHG